MLKTAKRILSLFLATVLIFGATPLVGFVGLELPEISAVFEIKATATDTAYTEGYYTYTVDENGYATITMVDKNINGNITIPSTLGGFHVIKKGSYAFCECTELTSIIIPDSVKEISAYAFIHCIGITSIVIPESVVEIGSYAFNGCTGLTSVVIPDSVSNLGGYVFGGCTGLTSVKISDKIAIIRVGCFVQCSNITSITIPDSVVEIGGYAFYECTRLQTVTIPDSVLYIDDYAFYNSGLESIRIPESVVEIGMCAFAQCNALKEIIIPASESVYDRDCFINCANIKKITITKGVGSITSTDGYDTVWGESNCSEIIIENGITNIDDGAFADSYNLEYIDIPNSVTRIGNNAFYAAMAMDYIHIPSSVTEIGNEIIVNDTVKASLIQEINSTLENSTEEELEEYAMEGITKENVANWKPTTAICSDTEDCYAKEYAEANGYTFVLCNGHNTEEHSHAYSSTITKDTSCTETGIITYTCGCGDSYTEDIAVIAHTDGEWETVIEATCTAQGKKVKKCTACGTVTANEIIPVITHSDNNSDGFCDSCDRITDEDLINGIYIAISPVEKHTIKYMESVTLTATTANLPEGYTVKWVAEGKGVTIKAYGNNCKVTSTSTGRVVIKAYVVDTKGRVVTDENGKPVCDSEYFHSDANFWLKIIYFFKTLFKFY